MAALHWNAETLIAAHVADGPAFARGMALFAGGLHDALLAVGASKTAYQTDRPIAAIRKGGDDGNPGAEGDASWVMFGDNTPPEDVSHCCASGGGTIGGCFANMLDRLVETDEVTFEHRFLDKAGARGFDSLSEMAVEFGRSRICNGEHFRHDVEAGWPMWDKIADHVFSNALTPNTPRRCGGASNARHPRGSAADRLPVRPGSRRGSHLASGGNLRPRCKDPGLSFVLWL
ncbi:MAG: hypothetical protein AAGI51_05440 [Pseudomonadota bacterium]